MACRAHDLGRAGAAGGIGMRAFDEIYAIAAARKAGSDALETRLSRPRSANGIRATPDDRWLSAMARSLFEAGFNWKAIEAKWPGSKMPSRASG